MVSVRFFYAIVQKKVLHLHVGGAGPFYARRGGRLLRSHPRSTVMLSAKAISRSHLDGVGARCELGVDPSGPDMGRGDCIGGTSSRE